MAIPGSGDGVGDEPSPDRPDTEPKNVKTAEEHERDAKTHSVDQNADTPTPVVTNTKQAKEIADAYDAEDRKQVWTAKNCHDAQFNHHQHRDTHQRLDQELLPPALEVGGCQLLAGSPISAHLLERLGFFRLQAGSCLRARGVDRDLRNREKNWGGLAVKYRF